MTAATTDEPGIQPEGEPPMTEQYPYPQQFPPQPAAPTPAKKRHRWIPWVAYPTVLLFGVIIGSAGGSSDGTAATTPDSTVTEGGATVKVPGPTKTIPGPRTTVTAQPPQPQAVITEDGVYLVGVDIKPGTYRGGVGEGDCYWARLSSTDGSLDGIIANSNGGNQVVTIKKSDKAFETTRCGEWKKIR